MAWLLRQGEVLASIDTPSSVTSRLRGYGRRDADDGGGVLLRNWRSAHSFGTRGPLDVAHLDADLVVVATGTLGRNRIGRPRSRGHHVLLAERGAFDRWGLRPGDRLEIKE